MRRADRREFLRTALGGVAAASLAPRVLGAADGGGPFSRLGYAAITWGGQDEQAIDDIAAVGFHGIQLRAPIVDKYGEKPAELRRRLEGKGLALLCLSSGTVDADVAGAVAALEKIGFRGPGVIELDTTEPGSTPRHAAEANKQYAVGVLALRL
jgi:hypothetical protein